MKEVETPEATPTVTTTPTKKASTKKQTSSSKPKPKKQSTTKSDEMSHNEFQKLAIRTESIVDEIEISEYDYDIFIKALDNFNESGEILDRFKKHIFYKKPLDYDAIAKHNKNVATNSSVINRQVSRGLKRESECRYLSIDIRVFHALIGIMTESSEIGQALHTALTTGESLDIVNVCEELGDSDWYKGLFYEATGIKWDLVRKMIIKKLELRFSDKIFKENDANVRDLDKERALLETAIIEAVNEYKQKASSST